MSDRRGWISDNPRLVPLANHTIMRRMVKRVLRDPIHPERMSTRWRFRIGRFCRKAAQAILALDPASDETQRTAAARALADRYHHLIPPAAEMRPRVVVTDITTEADLADNRMVVDIAMPRRMAEALGLAEEARP